MSAGETRAHSGTHAHYTLGVLLAIFVFSHVDRNILNILVEPIRSELGVSDTAMGWLTGPAFSVFYASLAVPIARLADRISRRTIVLVGLVLWSLVTAAQGLVRVFSDLAVARIMVGVGEATTSPASHSMISDLYPPERRAMPLALFGSGGHIGTMLGYMIGGVVNDWMGWRTAFVVVGLPGLALALLAWATIREPQRGVVEAQQDEREYGMGEVFRYLWSRRSFRHLNIACILYVASIYGFNVWGPTFLIRVHGMTTSEAGLFFGPVTGIAGLSGSLFSGWLSDRLARRDVRYSMWIPALGGVLAIPFGVAFLFADDPMLGLFFYGCQVFVATFWMGPGFWACQGLAKLRMRAMAAAVLLMNVNLFGMAMGPVLIGSMNDALRGAYGELGIRYSLLALCIPLLWAAFHSLAANRTLAADLAAAGDA